MLKLIIYSFLISCSFTFAQQFTKMENQPPVTDAGDSRSTNWIDYDGDGDLDLFITNGPRTGENNFLYKNENGSFVKITDVLITKDLKASDGSTWGDYDNDGDPDLFVGNWWGQNNLLYTNNFAGSFSLAVQKPSTEASFSETASWGDFNNDGFLDLYVANSSGNKKNFLYMNDGDGRFTKITEGDITNDAYESRSVDWIDINNDGLLDLFIANESNTKNSLYENNGDNTFTKNTNSEIVSNAYTSFSSSWADFDNDGDFDLFISNHSFQDNELYRNEGNGLFTKHFLDKVTNSRGYSVSSAWGDVDNDGDLDLLVTNAFAGNFPTNNFFYLNNGDGTFSSDQGLLTKNNGWSYSGEFGDFNNDGYLDLAVANCFNANENNSIYVNNGGTNNWLKINLEGSISNKSAIGSIVKLYSKIYGNEILQTRRIAGQSSYCSQNLQLHFGLGDTPSIDSLIVYWSSGQHSILYDVNINQSLSISEPIPDDYIKANFKADIISGPNSTTIKFTDLSVASSNNPITSWEWDFNNDGIIDSDQQNAEYTFTSSVSTNFTVKLKVSNGTKTSEKVRENYINISGVTSLDDFKLPDNILLNQNYPNPFNPSTTISFSIPETENMRNVILRVYDILGNIIRTIVNESKPAGFYEHNFEASDLSSGIYFYTLQINSNSITKKMMLIK